MDEERLAFKRTMQGAVKRIWKQIYLKEGDEVPWSDDEDEDDEAVPSDNVQRQTEKTSSSSSSVLSGNQKTCAHCGKGGNLSRCAKCKVAFYCSRSHQAADYAKHKADCQAPKAPVNDTAQPTKTKQEYESKPCDAQAQNNEQPPSSTWLICAHCGTKSENLSKCTRCMCTWYCSTDHQRAHYPEHKLECMMIAEGRKQRAEMPTNLFHPHIWANRTVCLMNRKNEGTMPKEYPVISWKELERMHPNVAIGRTLVVRFVSVEPVSLLGSKFIGRDAEGSERHVFLVTHRPPEGLKTGCLLHWRNPWYHHFAHGGSGANIEHWDLPNVSVFDG